MEQQQPRPDHVVVDIELQPANDVSDVVKPHRRPTGGGDDDCHAVDMEPLQQVAVAAAEGSPVADDTAKPAAESGGDADDDGSGCCVVCTEPLEWVVVGRCGHRVVCSRCMVRIRFFHQDKRCCICRTRCPKVLVAAASRDGAGNMLSALPRFALREGRVGKYWYHRRTAAYFEDEQQ